MTTNIEDYVKEPCWYCHYDHPRLDEECWMCDCEEPDEDDEEGDL